MCYVCLQMVAISGMPVQQWVDVDPDGSDVTLAGQFALADVNKKTTNSGQLRHLLTIMSAAEHMLGANQPFGTHQHNKQLERLIKMDIEVRTGPAAASSELERRQVCRAIVRQRTRAGINSFRLQQFRCRNPASA